MENILLYCGKENEEFIPKDKSLKYTFNGQKIFVEYKGRYYVAEANKGQWFLFKKFSERKATIVPVDKYYKKVKILFELFGVNEQSIATSSDEIKSRCEELRISYYNIKSVHCNYGKEEFLLQHGYSRGKKCITWNAYSNSNGYPKAIFAFLKRVNSMNNGFRFNYSVKYVRYILMEFFNLQADDLDCLTNLLNTH